MIRVGIEFVDLSENELHLVDLLQGELFLVDLLARPTSERLSSFTSIPQANSGMPG